MLKISNSVGRIDNFRLWARKIINSINRVRYFGYTTTQYRYSIYLSTFDLLNFIISYTDKHELYQYMEMD